MIYGWTKYVGGVLPLESIRKIWQPEMYYHVTTKGNNRQNIFLNDGDFTLFFRMLQSTYVKHPFSVIAYCMMNNHYHMLIRSQKIPLSDLIVFINKRYSEYFKRKYNYSGQLYETSFFASMVADPISLLNVSSYIHQNPSRMTRSFGSNIEDYRYSSHQYYFYQLKSPYPFLNTALLPSLLKKHPEIGTKDYYTYCQNFNIETHSYKKSGSTF